MRKRHPEAYNYMRLIWSPKNGDRVEFDGLKTKVKNFRKGKVTLSGIAGDFYTGQVEWRPTPQDFDAVLLKLADLWAYRELTGHHQVVGITCNGRIIPLRGRSVQILSQIIALRPLDSKISVTINRVFEQAYVPYVSEEKGQEKDVPRRIRGFKTKDSRPT